MGMIGRRAPELRVRRWIGGNGEALGTPLKLSDLGTRVKILFAFQHWCSGCHSHGFPTLQRFYSILAPMGVGFAAIQMVFEGADENTLEKLNLNQRKYSGFPSPSVTMCLQQAPRIRHSWRTIEAAARPGSPLSTRITE